jgi:DNA N-6-adenine-methyltransferase (Dam).
MKKTLTDFAGRTVHSQSQHWCTPPQYVEAVTQVFGGVIDLDPCSNTDSIVHAKHEFLLPHTDGLLQDWNYKTIYMNPPYGADRSRGTTIKDWLGKCVHTHKQYGSEIIALIPVATNTMHWKHFIFGEADAVCFLFDTRLKFLVNGTTDNKGAPMACAMVYWGGQYETFYSVFQKFGAVVCLDNLKLARTTNTKKERLLFAI